MCRGGSPGRGVRRQRDLLRLRVRSRGPTPSRLRSGLRRSLPNYMLPTRWLAFDALPKNANGKIDRSALRERFDRELAQASAE